MLGLSIGSKHSCICFFRPTSRPSHNRESYFQVYVALKAGFIGWPVCHKTSGTLTTVAAWFKWSKRYDTIVCGRSRRGYATEVVPEQTFLSFA